MQRNKIEHIRAFNGGFWYRSCFYHQLMFAVGAFGIDGRELLLQDFLYYGKNFRISQNIMPQSKLYKSMGTTLQHINVTDFETAVKYIDKGIPVLIGVDTYYYTARDDYYGKYHAPHFVLVYGYDKNKHTFDIVDHEFNNSYLFKEKEWGAEDILNASKKYSEGICAHKCTSILVKPCSPAGEKIFDKIIQNYQLIDKSIENFENDIDILKKVMNSGGDVILKYSAKFSEFFYTAHFKRECLSESLLGEKYPQLKITLRDLSERHAYFRAIFLRVERWKEVRFIEKYREKLQAKLDELLYAETDFFKAVKELL